MGYFQTVQHTILSNKGIYHNIPFLTVWQNDTPYSEKWFLVTPKLCYTETAVDQAGVCVVITHY